MYWQRIEKCRALVRHFYPHSGFAPYVEHFILAHEAAGMGDQWQWSLAYGASGIDLRCHFRGRNGCAGPMDRPGGSTDPVRNIDAHVAEMRHYYPREQGYTLMKRVFYPRAPRDWGGGRIKQAYETHRRYLEGIR